MMKVKYVRNGFPSPQRRQLRRVTDLQFHAAAAPDRHQGHPSIRPSIPYFPTALFETLPMPSYFEQLKMRSFPN